MTVNLEQIFARATYGINVSKRIEVRYGIRLVPFVEVYSNDPDHLKQIHMELLRSSVSSNVRPKFLRIQGVQNCLILTRYCKELWWLKAMQMFANGDHYTRDGIIKLMYLREKRENATPMQSRTTLDEVVKTVMEA